MKCPVCNSELKAKVTVCPVCSFDDIRYEFINDEELRMWQNYVIQPCKYAYRLNCVLQNEVAMLRKEINKMSIDSFADDGLGDKENAGTRRPSQPAIQENKGWNYDGPIAHPKFASCKSAGKITTCEVSRIEAKKQNDGAIEITFLAKKTFNDAHYGTSNDIHVRYRVKDSDGIILLNEYWSYGGIIVGDVVKGRILLKNIPENCSIDFIDF